VISFFMPVILCVTVLASLSLGVFSAYALIFSMLSLFGRTARPDRTVRPRLALVPRQNHAGGD